MNERKNQKHRKTRIRRYTCLSILLFVLCLTGITYSKMTVEATTEKKRRDLINTIQRYVYSAEIPYGELQMNIWMTACMVLWMRI